MEKREIKTKAIVVASEDSGDADRIITLLTLDSGKIKAKIRGVKKSKAKLAYASFPFNFGEYILVQTGRSYTVINCSYIDNFQGLTIDLNRYYAGAGLLEIASNLSREGSDTYELALLLLKSLKELCYNEDLNIFTTLSKFLVEILSFAGFKLTADDGARYFDFELGKLKCDKAGEIIELDEADAIVLRELISSNELNTINASKTLLKLLILFYENKVDEEIKIIKKFIWVIGCPKFCATDY